MRGKGCTAHVFLPFPGITPAYAGKRIHRQRHNQRREDHPRTCGEKLIPPLLGFGLTGSPPHMRGKGSVDFDLRHRVGITPAHAGKRKGHQRRVARGQDHPRTCGEKKKCFITTTSRSGSPPHMRGKVPEYLGGDRIMRITPAHAGKRLSQYSARTLTRDHPRTCGEKNIVRKASFDPQGSPPHMRGKGADLSGVTGATRITPAHAGKSSKMTHNYELRRDHPRTCGEKSCCGFHMASILGSPPHMRGKD